MQPTFEIAASSHLIIGRSETPNVEALYGDKFAELEFSDYGRSPHLIGGWWIVPGMLVGTAVLAIFL